MTRDSLPRRIADQFSYRGAGGEIWRVFDRLLDTDKFLNLGYARRYRPYLLGSSGRRLSAEVGDTLADRLGRTEGTRLLDLGCGRGGPAILLAEELGVDVTGVDLVGYNVARARANAEDSEASPEFVVGDSQSLPFVDDAFGACASVDAIVYLTDKPEAFGELARVLETRGVLALSDLVVANGVDGASRATVDAFAEAWDMPPIPTAAEYRRMLEDAGFTVEGWRDISANSTGRFRKYTWLYVAVSARLPGVVGRLLDRWTIDQDVVDRRIRLAHAALPWLEHMVVAARRR